MMGIGEGEKYKVNDVDEIFKKITEGNFPRLTKHTIVQIQEAHRTPTRQTQKRKSPHHIIVKTRHVTKEKIKHVLKVTGEKNVSHI